MALLQSRLRFFLRRVLVWLEILALILLLKFLWYFAVFVDTTDRSTSAAKEELFARRDYLAYELGPGFTPSSLILPFSDEYRGEWAIGSLSMFSLALTNLSFLYPETQAENVAILATLIEHAQLPAFRAFEVFFWDGEDPLDSIAGNNGHIGYLGHLNLMLGAFRIAGGDARFDELHRQITETLARRFRSAPFPMLRTYKHFPYFIPDNTVVLASLAMFDTSHGSDHSDILKAWGDYARKYLVDPVTGILGFWGTEDGHIAGPARGSGAGWQGFYLPFIDRELAREQYRLTKSFLAVDLPLSWSALREVPRGTRSVMDVDSGPVILGLSTSGTGFILAGARHSGDHVFAGRVLRLGEYVGSSINIFGKKRYLFAPVVGDAILLAGNTATEWDSRYLTHE